MPNTTTREHVIRCASTAYRGLVLSERAVAVRLSHRACNEACGRWSLRHPVTVADQEAKWGVYECYPNPLYRSLQSLLSTPLET